MGSSLMNVLVSLGQSGDRRAFGRAFSAATLSDAFNLMNYLTVLPVEISFGVLEKLSGLIVQPLSKAKTSEFKTLQLFTEPLLSRIVQVDSKAITRVSAIPENITIERPTFIYRCIDMKTGETLPFCPYEHLFAYSTLSDTTIGIILLVGSVLTLIACLIGIVKIIQALLAGQVAVFVRKTLAHEFPYPFGFLTGYLIMIVGALIVVIVQSSSVFRSALTPLVGLGVIPLDRYYALLLGANIGTTSTGLLASLAAGSENLQATLQISLCQILYNVFGVILFYPVPFLRNIPIRIATKLGDTTAKYRWFALYYIFLIFCLLPGVMLILSLLPSNLMFIILILSLIFIATILIINWFQVSFPQLLPETLKTWDFLPDYLHSLRPYHSKMQKLCSKLPFFPRRFFETQEDSNEPRAPFHQPIALKTPAILKQTPV
ncbi:Sodium-dependent inorganic phosphate transporter [Aphelenchoides besseyi]|nr:Sodium-dependent inorganic phosphate transporter [Aphelenchoides besseyi]